MLNKTVLNYLSTARGLPFFYVVDDSQYLSILDELKQTGLGVIRVSDFCKQNDKFPSIDGIIDSFRTADIDYKTNKYVLIGLGEYLALRGETEVLKVLRSLKSTTLGAARVVILLRYVRTQVSELLEEDLRLKQNRVFFGGNDAVPLSIVNIQLKQDLGLVKRNGIKGLLQSLENGDEGVLYVKTSLDLKQSVLPVTAVTCSYEGIKTIIDGFSMDEGFGDDESWGKLLSDLLVHDKSIMEVLKRYNYHFDIEHDFIDRAFGFEYKNWLYFIALKMKINKIANPYLRFVVNKTTEFATFKNEILNAIIEVPHNDPQFLSLYEARKKLLRNVSEADVAIFIRMNEVDIGESIYKYTDNTLMEKHAILQWVAEFGMIPEIERIYPALHSYLRKYIFDCGKISTQLTDYFYRYKLQKVCNKLDENFESAVCEKASLYTGLETRANAISAIEDKNSCYLFWIDAMGVEYLSYIQDLANAKGLSIKIDIVRSELPTITVINKTFYDEWPGDKKIKQSELDEIKHKEKGGFDYRKNQAPVHLADELSVIEEAINRAAVELAMHSCKKFIIASDHGASRLAVISRHEEKYETDTKGEHSGRCCKYFEGYDLAHSVAENGYIVLTNYGRFKGSRAANVEVHGGGTLEETVIPLITLSLKAQTSVEVKILEPEKIIVDRKNGISVTLYISDVENKNNVRLSVNDKYYVMQCIDKTHYKLVIPDIKRSGKYSANVYDGTNLISSVTIPVKGAVGSANSGFDDMF